MNKKRYTALQIFLNAFNGNKNLDSELFLTKKQNNIQASSGKELNITKLFLVSKKEKRWFLFCISVINLSYIFLWSTFAYEYQIINKNNTTSFYHLLLDFSLVTLVIPFFFFLYKRDLE